MPRLPDLPEDLLFMVFTQFLTIQDVLSLQQTCRVLHAFGRSDYLWHRLALSVSDHLLFDTAHRTLSSLSYKELQQSIVRAIRVDANWRKPQSHIRTLTRVFHGGIVYAMTLLQSNQRLATLSRKESGATFLFLWDISSVERSHVLASVEVPSATRLAGTVLEDGSTLVAVLSSSRVEESLSVFSFAALDSSEVDNLFPPAPRRIYHMSQHKSDGVLGEVQVCGNVVSVTVAVFATGFIPPTFRVLLINALTGLVLHVDPPLGVEITHITCKVFPTHVLLITTIRDGLVLLRLYTLPSAFTLPRSHNLAPISCVELVSECRYSLGNGYDFYFSSGLFLPSHAYARLSMLAYPTFNPFSGGTASFHAFHIDLAARPPTITVLPGLSKQYQVPPGAFANMVCLGTSGTRGVWLENLAESDDMRLVKSQCQYGSTPPLTVFGELAPAHITLPFAMQACKSVSFDEAIGRVCLGLHTGELYFLDF